MGKQLPIQPCLYSQQAHISVSSFFHGIVHVVFIQKGFYDFYLTNTDSYPSRYFRHHLLNETLLKLHSLLRQYARILKFLSTCVINIFKIYLYPFFYFELTKGKDAIFIYILGREQNAQHKFSVNTRMNEWTNEIPFYKGIFSQGTLYVSVLISLLWEKIYLTQEKTLHMDITRW